MPIPQVDNMIFANSLSPLLKLPKNIPSSLRAIFLPLIFTLHCLEVEGDGARVGGGQGELLGAPPPTVGGGALSESLSPSPLKQ